MTRGTKHNLWKSANRAMRKTKFISNRKEWIIIELEL